MTYLLAGSFLLIAALMLIMARLCFVVRRRDAELAASHARIRHLWSDVETMQGEIAGEARRFMRKAEDVLGHLQRAHLMDVTIVDPDDWHHRVHIYRHPPAKARAGLSVPHETRAFTMTLWNAQYAFAWHNPGLFSRELMGIVLAVIFAGSVADKLCIADPEDMVPV